MAISGPKSTEILFFILSCMELQPLGLLSPMALVHLLVHAGWWDQLAPLGWTVAMLDRNIFVLSQSIFISQPIVA
jgi:hypothetical protein